MTLHPHDLDRSFIEALHRDGLDDAAIRGAVNVGFHYNDEDIDELRAAGYSDNALFELTAVGSTAAALVGLECVYAAMVA